MKKFILLGLLCCSLLPTPQSHAQTAYECCPKQEQATGWCLCRYYEPCYYNDWECVEEMETRRIPCCRYVPKEREMRYCRYVPQYYTAKVCCMEAEHYYLEECRPVKKWVCKRKCRYIPRYYYKPVCPNECPQGNP